MCRHLNHQPSSSIDDEGVDVSDVDESNVDVSNVDVFNFDVSDVDVPNGVSTFIVNHQHELTIKVLMCVMLMC